MSVKGYKVIGPDWKCKDFKYEVGKTYKHTGAIGLCEQGFHFCERASNCFNYYYFDSRNHVVEIEALGVVESDGKKSVTNEIKIVREIEWSELLKIVNEGEDCTGYKNTGNVNSGSYNTGDFNAGNFNTGWRNIGDYNTSYGNTGCRNTGDWNTGNCNVGYRNAGFRNAGNDNIGNFNTGNYNVGDFNTGYINTGDGNTGDWNSGDWNTGFFCTNTPKVRAFNVQTDISRQDWLKIKGVQILNYSFANSWWIPSIDMTNEEKRKHPEYLTTGGYLKTVGFREACAIMWNRFDEKQKQAVRDIPYFNAEIFKKITGIDVTK